MTHGSGLTPTDEMEELEWRARVKDGDRDARVEEEAFVPHPHHGRDAAVHLQRQDQLTQPLLQRVNVTSVGWNK